MYLQNVLYIGKPYKQIDSKFPRGSTDLSEVAKGWKAVFKTRECLFLTLNTFRSMIIN